MRALSGAGARSSARYGWTAFGSTFVTHPSVRWGWAGVRHQPTVRKNDRRPGPSLRSLRDHPSVAPSGTYQRRTLSEGGCHPMTPHQVPAAPREARTLGAVASAAERRAHTAAAAHQPSGDQREVGCEVRRAFVARVPRWRRSFSGRTSWCAWLPLGRRPRTRPRDYTVSGRRGDGCSLAGVTRAWPPLPTENSTFNGVTTSAHRRTFNAGFTGMSTTDPRVVRSGARICG